MTDIIFITFFGFLLVLAIFILDVLMTWLYYRDDLSYLTQLELSMVTLCDDTQEWLAYQVVLLIVLSLTYAVLFKTLKHFKVIKCEHTTLHVHLTAATLAMVLISYHGYTQTIKATDLL